jgi:hypothetical protein
MGILAELEKLNPATIIADLEAAKTKIVEYEARISQLEALLVSMSPAIESAVSLIAPGTPIPAAVTVFLEGLKTFGSAKGA